MFLIELVEFYLGSHLFLFSPLPGRISTGFTKLCYIFGVFVSSFSDFSPVWKYARKKINSTIDRARRGSILVHIVHFLVRCLSESLQEILESSFKISYVRFYWVYSNYFNIDSTRWTYTYETHVTLLDQTYLQGEESNFQLKLKKKLAIL